MVLMINNANPSLRRPNLTRMKGFASGWRLDALNPDPSSPSRRFKLFYAV